MREQRQKEVHKKNNQHLDGRHDCLLFIQCRGLSVQKRSPPPDTRAVALLQPSSGTKKSPDSPAPASTGLWRVERENTNGGISSTEKQRMVLRVNFYSVFRQCGGAGGGVEWKGWWRGWGWDAEMLLTGRRPQQIKTDSEGAQPCEALLELALGLRGRRRRSVTGGGRLPPLVPPSSATTWQSFFFSGSRQRKQEV